MRYHSFAALLFFSLHFAATGWVLWNWGEIAGMVALIGGGLINGFLVLWVDEEVLPRIHMWRKRRKVERFNRR